MKLKLRKGMVITVMVILIVGLVIKLIFPSTPEGNFVMLLGAILGMLLMIADWKTEKE